MDKNEKKDVLNALDRINRSLDERFEKDADLYIAPEQVEKLKRLIYLGNYQQIVKECDLKIYSANVLANVLIKNAWLIRNNRFDERLQTIFDKCDYSYLFSVMHEGVFDNKIEMPTQFRLKILVTFLKRSQSLTCRQMLGQNLLFLNHPMLKAICINQALKDELLLDRYRLFSSHVKQEERILQQRKFIVELFPAEEFTDTLRTKIFEDHIKHATPATSFWLSRLGANDIPFMMAQFKKFCRLNSSDPFVCKEVFGRLYPLYKNDFETFTKGFAEACNCMDGFKKVRLAQSFLNRTKADEEKILRDRLSDYGIELEDKGNLADVEAIIHRLATDADYQYERAKGYLTASFDKNYYNDYENTLNRIRQELPSSRSLANRFENFCLTLVEHKHWHLGYLLYAIEHLVPVNANKNHPLVSKLLTYIKNKDVLRANKLDENIGKVDEFVKTMDFDLYIRLKQF